MVSRVASDRLKRDWLLCIVDRKVDDIEAEDIEAGDLEEDDDEKASVISVRNRMQRIIVIDVVNNIREARRLSLEPRAFMFLISSLLSESLLWAF
jgi:hypothetical protein